jgi:hypothetical protein
MLLLKQEPESYLFPTERETPLRRDNVWYRDILPKLKPAGLEWATFQVLRRTNASLSRKAMIGDKVAADQRAFDARWAELAVNARSSARQF